MFNNTTNAIDDNHETIIKIFCSSIYVLNVLLHSSGIYFFGQAHYRYNENFQSKYIINMAAMEILWNLACFGFAFNSFFNYNYYRSLIIIFVYFISWYAYYAAMILIVCDRLYQTIFPFSYRTKWTAKKTNISIAISWVISIFFTSCVILQDSENLKYFHFLEIMIIVLITYLLFFIAAYITMFAVFVKTRRRSQPNHNLTLWTIFRNSRFYFSFLLVGSYVMLTVVPEMCYYISLHTSIFHIIRLTGDIALSLSSTVDALLYVFAQKQVRKIFIKKLCCCRKRQNKNRNRRNELGLRLLSVPMTTANTILTTTPINTVGTNNQTRAPTTEPTKEISIYVPTALKPTDSIPLTTNASSENTIITCTDYQNRSSTTEPTNEVSSFVQTVLKSIDSIPLITKVSSEDSTTTGTNKKTGASTTEF